MRTGMLWYDNSRERTLAEKVEKGAGHYEAKYGRRPNLCYVHPSMLFTSGGFPNTPDIEVKGTNMVLPHHFWFGLSKEPEAA